ncbi:hypothetical protein C2G38_2307036 [Gigaspora rosea]|uniref:Uncharacterized protein n=1 Tax=Gigaspora rosea TaxID=44941 RepID=A0A397VCH2_9GLOM|nr:hypothetical protein C2G38_2307036 [Gigaspora rosea]
MRPQIMHSCVAKYVRKNIILLYFFFLIVSTYQRPKAHTLKCIFADLVERYKAFSLRPCETSELQTWRHADSANIAKNLLKYHDYIPKLAERQSSLTKYSICQIHYNQVINTNQFFQHIIGCDQENKRTRLDKSNLDIASHVDLAVKLDQTKRLLESVQVENRQKSQEIMTLNNKIVQMQQHIDNQKDEIEMLRGQLQKARNDIIEIQNLYSEQYKYKETLIEQWNSRYADQQKRIDAIVEIANTERVSFFDDVSALIQDKNWFSMENIVLYSPREWLNKGNQVIVKFIKNLVKNNRDTDILNQEKLFKIAVIVDLLYGARHEKYVSEIQLALSAIKYSIARSKMIINIDNHITSSGSYNRFQKWIEELARHEEPLPEGFLFLAFDNEQRGQKNYLDRGFNTVVYHTVTSFVVFNMSLQNRIQHTTNSLWAYNSLNILQYDELFEVSPQMQEIVDEELHNYLDNLLNLLSQEKSSSTNTIDVLAAST